MRARDRVYRLWRDPIHLVTDSPHMQCMQMLDALAAQEKESESKGRKVKAERSLKAFARKTAPDMAEELKRE